MNELERFLAVMEYKPVDRVPNHELGVWSQTVVRWAEEGMPPNTLFFDWFVGEEYLKLDRREYIPMNLDMIPAFKAEILEETDEYQVIRHANGVVTRALKEGTVNGGRSCMDTYISFAVEKPEDFEDLKKRFIPSIPERYQPNWKEELLPGWKTRQHPLVLGRNCTPGGFYWRAREWMGTENLSLAWYDYPEMMTDMMEFYADFTIESLKPILAETDVEYFNFNEDFAMKSGPLLGPDTLKKFIFKPMKRLIEFLKSNGVKYVGLDSDGAPEPLVPLLMDAGVDILWPLERASEGVDPMRYRKKFGKSLRLMGGVDKRELMKDHAAIDAHLKSLIPMVEDGGFIPTIDHCASPDISWDNFMYYMEVKRKLLDGTL
ncbi:MAG: uroporphyrinogen decarboxylase family protein [Armatimonadota bacterium]